MLKFLVFIFVYMFGTVVVLGEVEPAKFITTMDVFPDEVRIGDTIYLVIKCSNNTDTDRYCQVPEPNNLFQHSGDSIRYFVLVDNEEWEIIVPVVLVIHGHVLVPPYVLVPSGKTVSTYTSGFRFNELEDLHSNFWVNSIKKLPEQGKEITFKVLILSGFGVVDRRYPLIFNKKIKLKPRPNNEMTIFEKWYRNTPQKTFPNLYEEKTSSKYQPVWKRKLERDFSFLESSQIDKNLVHVLRIGNRYPGHPNLPADWQGWQELEESFVASTLRDEIRWTRICIHFFKPSF